MTLFTGERTRISGEPGPLEDTLVELTRYLIVKYQDFVPMFFARSVATIFTVFLPGASAGEL